MLYYSLLYHVKRWTIEPRGYSDDLRITSHTIYWFICFLKRLREHPVYRLVGGEMLCPRWQFRSLPVITRYHRPWQPVTVVFIFTISSSRGSILLVFDILTSRFFQPQERFGHFVNWSRLPTWDFILVFYSVNRSSKTYRF